MHYYSLTASPCVFLVCLAATVAIVAKGDTLAVVHHSGWTGSDGQPSGDSNTLVLLRMKTNQMLALHYSPQIQCHRHSECVQKLQV